MSGKLRDKDTLMRGGATLVELILFHMLWPVHVFVQSREMLLCCHLRLRAAFDSEMALLQQPPIVLSSLCKPE